MPDDVIFSIERDALLDALDVTRAACAHVATPKHAIDCQQWEIVGETLTIIGMDRVRLAFAECAITLNKGGNFTGLFPAWLADAIGALPEYDRLNITILGDNGWMVVKPDLPGLTDDACLYVAQRGGEFPSWRNLIPTEQAIGDVLVNPKLLGSLLVSLVDCESSENVASIEFREKGKPLVVRSGNATALVMPRRE